MENLLNLPANQLAKELASEKNIGSYVTVCNIVTQKKMKKVYKVLDILYKNQKLGTDDGDFRFCSDGIQIRANEN